MNGGESLKVVVERIEAGIERVDREQDVRQHFTCLCESPRQCERIASVKAGGGDIESSPEIISDSAHALIVGADR